MPDIADTDIIAPHFKRRLSGVTSTIVQLVPRQVAAGVRIATLGPGLPPDLPKIRYRQLAGLWRPLPGGRPRIWHARRNIEMLAGIFLRDLLRMKLRLLFTSASQRRHTRYSRWLIGRMDHVVATSAKTGSFLTVPHTVVMHGIDTTRFRPAVPGERPAPSARRRIGCAGRIRHQKGTDLFIDALIALLPRYPDWEGEAIGRVTPEHEGFAEDLRSRIAAAGLSDRLRLAAETTEIPAWYRGLDLYVAPSRTEGFGLTPLEAMASGVPVVAGDVGAYPELIVEGETGAVVPTGDLAAYIAAIETYLMAPERARRHGENALTHARGNFNISNEVDGLSAVYAALAASGTGSRPIEASAETGE
ncbi:MAG: glycosyltransferase family 4 protein [Rhizobiaceae bacterium]|nr:glycosyltransferase family 4 protein [Rhizobiaceae bacterium]